MMTNTTMTTNGLISEYVCGSDMAPMDGSVDGSVDGADGWLHGGDFNGDVGVQGYEVLDGVGECMEDCWDGICSEDYSWDIPWEK